MAYGVRALAKILLTYEAKYGLKTVQQIISRWAPPIENNTFAYIQAVASAMKVSATSLLNLRDPATLSSLVSAIIAHENGPAAALVEPSDIGEGVQLALA
jgi:hypothetical protein